MNKGGFSWKRALGITKQKQRISRATGIPLTKSGRQRKVGRTVTGGGCLLAFAAIMILFLVPVLFGCGSATTTTLTPVTSSVPSTATSAATPSEPPTTTTLAPTTTQAPSTTMTARRTTTTVKKVTTTEAANQDASLIVYVTETGEKYHRDGCSSLSKSKIEISLADAKAEGYTPCSRCKPPQ